MDPHSPSLPDGVELAHLRTEVKDLRLAVINDRPGARARAAKAGPVNPADFSLSDAQDLVAREYGFASWPDVVSEFGRRQPQARDLHRWFAVELNNDLGDLMFDLTPQTPRAVQEQALYQSYAACYHWLVAGTVTNHGRGEYAIARTALAIGRPQVAAEHAARYAELISNEPEAFADWDPALAAEINARIAAALGAADAGPLRAEAGRLAELVEDDDARDVVQDRLEREPWFGLRS